MSPDAFVPATSMSTVISARFASEESPTVAVAVFCPAVIATGLDRMLVPLSLISIVGLPEVDVLVRETFTAVRVKAYGILNVVFAVPTVREVSSSEAEIMNASVGVEDIVDHAPSPLRYVDELADPVVDIPAIGSPVVFVKVPLAGVPNAGVVNVGEVKVNPATVEIV